MRTTLTIRNLNETVKQKLRIRAARHQTSMEAEARSILTRAVDEPDAVEACRDREALMAERRKRIEAVVGVWKDRGTTDDLMALTRGED
jgi:antitoxin FitA